MRALLREAGRGKIQGTMLNEYDDGLPLCLLVWKFAASTGSGQGVYDLS